MSTTHNWTERLSTTLRHDEAGTLLCPVAGCDYGYIHIDRAIVHSYPAPGHGRVRALDFNGEPTTDGGYPISADRERSSFSLAAWCEGGHELVISFVQRKGQTSIDVYLREMPGSELTRGN